jgi:nucleoside-triphosphatase THEP1
MILVLTGPVHSGKTTFLRGLLPDLEASGVSVCGYLSITVMKEGEIVGYDLFDIKERQLTPFLRTYGEDGWQKVGSYFFLPRGLEAATSAILGSKRGELLIVDEVGPMEIAGRGVWPALSQALSRFSSNCLLVVRKPLLDDLRLRLGRTPVKVFDIKQQEVLPALLQALSD